MILILLKNTFTQLRLEMYTFRSFWATVCKTVRAMLSDRCLSVLTVLSCLPVCSVSVGSYCGQTVGYIKMPLGTEVGFGPGYIVLDWDPAAPPQKKRAQLPIFGPCYVVAKRLD